MFCAHHINMMWCVYMPTNVHDVRIKCHADELMCMIWCAVSHTFEHTGYQQLHGCVHNVLTTKTAWPLLPGCRGYSLGLFWTSVLAFWNNRKMNCWRNFDFGKLGQALKIGFWKLRFRYKKLLSKNNLEKAIFWPIVEGPHKGPKPFMECRV